MPYTALELQFDRIGNGCGLAPMRKQEVQCESCDPRKHVIQRDGRSAADR